MIKENSLRIQERKCGQNAHIYNQTNPNQTMNKHGRFVRKPIYSFSSETFKG